MLKAYFTSSVKVCTHLPVVPENGAVCVWYLHEGPANFVGL